MLGVCKSATSLEPRQGCFKHIAAFSRDSSDERFAVIQPFRDKRVVFLHLEERVKVSEAAESVITLMFGVGLKCPLRVCLMTDDGE